MKNKISVIVLILFCVFASSIVVAFFYVNNFERAHVDTTDVYDSKADVLMMDLRGKNLQKVPEYIFTQKDLHELDISDNQLTGAIPGEIRHLQNLEILDMSGNDLTGIPAEVGQLQNLRILDVSDNNLTGLPYELGNLKNLEIFDISGNNYSKQDLEIIRNQLPVGVQIVE